MYPTYMITVTYTKYKLYGTIPVPSLYHSHAKYKLYNMYSTLPIDRAEFIHWVPSIH